MIGKYVLIASAAASLVAATQDPGMLEFPVTVLKPLTINRRATDGILDGSISNLKQYYALQFSLGTPPQEMEVVLDTGSSDFWVMSPEVDICRRGECVKGSVFDDSKSSTFRANDTNFYQAYGDQTSANGTWAQDTLTIGSANVTNFNFALAYHATSKQAVAGIGLPLGETPYILDSISEPYANLPVQLKQQGIISHMAYSLFLDSFSDSTGSILFGGINKGAYNGDIYKFPMVPVDSADIDRLAIKLQAVSIIDGDGKRQELAVTSFPVVLDSGSTVSSLPSELLGYIAGAIGAYYEDESGLVLINCDKLSNNRGGIGFTFGNVEFVVNFSDLLVEAKDNICIAGFQKGEIPLFGDNILRTLYVVYDLENLEIGLAQANTGSATQSSYETIGSTIPGINAPGYNETRVSNAYHVSPVTPIGRGSVRSLVLGRGTTLSYTLATAASPISTYPSVAVSVTVGGTAGASTGSVNHLTTQSKAGATTSKSKGKQTGGASSSRVVSLGSFAICLLGTLSILI